MEHPAIAFLRQLDPSQNGRFNIETYTDLAKGQKRPEPDPLARRFPKLNLEGVHKRLTQLKDLNVQGAGVFVAVNEFNGQRRRENLVHIRGVHADLDGVTQEVLDGIRTRLKPTLEVKTSGEKNWHFYWLLQQGETLTAEEAEGINRGLVDLGADRAAVDVARLLRLPGFFHMKHVDRGIADA